MSYTVKVDPIDMNQPISYVDFETLEETVAYCNKLENKPVYFYVIKKAGE